MSNTLTGSVQIHDIVDKLLELERDIAIRDKLLKEAMLTVRAAAYVSGVLDWSLELEDHRDRKIATAKCMLEELANAVFLTGSEMGVKDDMFVDPELSLSDLWNAFDSRLVTVGGKVTLSAQPDPANQLSAEDQLEKFLLKTKEWKTWPTDGEPTHWYIIVKDEDWFNEFAGLNKYAKFSKEKGDFTEINFVPDNFIHFAGWRGNTVFSAPLYPREEQSTYTLKEGLKKISEFILDGKIELPGFKYN